MTDPTTERDQASFLKLLRQGWRGDTATDLMRDAANRIETLTGDVAAERTKIAHEVHDWGALHAGPEGANAARVIERRIRARAEQEGASDE